MKNYKNLLKKKLIFFWDKIISCSKNAMESKKEFTTEDVRNAVKILQQAEQEFKTKLQNHFAHALDRSYWALQGCNECFAILIKIQQP